MIPIAIACFLVSAVVTWLVGAHRYEKKKVARAKAWEAHAEHLHAAASMSPWIHGMWGAPERTYHEMLDDDREKRHAEIMEKWPRTYGDDGPSPLVPSDDVVNQWALEAEYEKYGTRDPWAISMCKMRERMLMEAADASAELSALEQELADAA